MATEVTIKTNQQKATLNALTTVQRALMTITDQLSKTDLKDIEGYNELFDVVIRYEHKTSMLRLTVQQNMRGH